jgi:tetratricopeptide (TPR) repeat protein
MPILLLNWLALLLGCLGYIDQAYSRSGAALAAARRLCHPFTLADTLVFALLTGWCVGSEPEALLRSADEHLALSVERGFRYNRAVGLVIRGWCLAALGHADEGIPLLTTGLADFEEFGCINWKPQLLAQVADARRMAGQWDVALGHLAEAQRLAEETEDRWYQAETLRLRGDVLLATGDLAAAEVSYHEAIAIAQQQSAKLWELRAATSLARLLRDQGKRTEARDLLAPVYDWFTEGFATKDLRDAKALLAELADASAVPASGG